MDKALTSELKAEPKVIKDYRISLLRLLAFLSIFSCHIMQYYNIELAYWFNVGVQIFLVISGYLYGSRNTKDPIAFYKKALTKILVPYYIVILPVLLMHAVFIKDILPADAFLSLLVVRLIPGGEHLWFVLTILMCYLITPLINSILSKIENRRNLSVRCLLLIVGVALFFLFHIKKTNFVWVSCYVIGLAFGKFGNRINALKNVLIILTATNLVQIYIDYIAKYDLSNSNIYPDFCSFAHLTLGFSLFVLCMKLFSHINLETKTLRKICNFSDRYSYSAYLFHQFIILGPLSLLKTTNNVVFNIILVFVATILTAVIIKTIADKISSAVHV